MGLELRTKPASGRERSASNPATSIEDLVDLRFEDVERHELNAQATGVDPIDGRADRHRLTRMQRLRELPHRLAVELSYGFIANLSNIANAVDNRSYTKHTIGAAADYYF